MKRRAPRITTLLAFCGGIGAYGALVACYSGRGDGGALPDGVLPDGASTAADASTHDRGETTPVPGEADAGAVVAPVCSTVAPTACPEGGVPTYAELAPVFQARCAGCHAGVPGGPWPFNDYEDVADWQETIRAALLDCTMPPADAGFTLPADEATAILVWLRCGLPR